MEVQPAIPRDGFLVAWADQIAKDVPGFPEGKMLIKQPELLVEVLTTLTFNASFKHSLDHKWATSYTSMLCARVRFPPPTHDIPLTTAVPQSSVWWLIDYWKTYIFEVRSRNRRHW